MPTVTLTREDGKIAGVTDRDKKKYAKWQAKVKALGPKDSVIFSWKEPRSGPHHRLYFKQISMLMDIQEQFECEERLREWLQVGAGYCDLLPGPYGKPVAISRSINYETLEEPEFCELHNKVNDFLRSQYATRFLWPHLSGDQQADMVEIFLKGFEKE